MEIILIIIGCLILIALLYLVFSRKGGSNDSGLTLLLEQMNNLSRVVDEKLGRSHQEMTESLKFQSTRSHELIKEITRELTEVKETGKQVVSFTEQLQSLQDILKNPKQRGVLGEYYLETLLKNVLPPDSYKMQYQLGRDDSGNELIPDAAVFVKEKIIPIDSKFSLENYNRISETSDLQEKERLEKLFINDLKNRIIETSKYVQPSKGTMDFAFMFIPHEAIYYDLLVNRIGAMQTEDTENLIQRAASKYRVIIVSPTSFLAYLQTVLQALNALHIEEQAQDIVKRVGELGKHLKSYEEYHLKLGNALSTTVNHYNASGKELKKVDKDILRVTGDSIGIESELLERPEREE